MNADLEYIWLRRHGKTFDAQIAQHEKKKKEDAQQVVNGFVKELDATQKAAQGQLEARVKELAEDPYLAPVQQQLKNLSVRSKEAKQGQKTLEATNKAAQEDLQKRLEARKPLQQRVDELRQLLNAKKQVPEEGKIYAIGERAVKHAAGLPQPK